MQELTLTDNLLSTVQVTQMFTQIAESPNASLKLAKLNLDSVNLSSVPPILLAQAAIRLQELSLIYTQPRLSIAQLTQMFTQIADSSDANLKLTKLDLSSVDLSSVLPIVLAQAAIRLEELDLRNTKLIPVQVTPLFTQIAETINGSIKLTKLNLSFVNLSSVPPLLLAQAAIRLQELNLRSTKLSREQLTLLFTQIADSSDANLKLVKFDLYDGLWSEPVRKL